MIELFASTLRLSTPLIFAAMGGLLCERSGVATICLEGALLNAAFFGAATQSVTHSPILAIVVGLFSGALTLGLHALIAVFAKADQIVSGVVVNLLAAGTTPFLSNLFFGSPTNTPSIPLDERLSPVWLVALALCLPFVMHWIWNSSGIGMRIIASGDHPEALATCGIRPTRVRLYALLAGGAITGLGGVFLSTMHASQFTRDMSAGRGFIALTAIIFGKWKPMPAFFACLLFGFADALQIRLQGASVAGMEIPVQFIQVLPYAATLFVLIVFVGRAKPPLSIGK